MNSRWAGSTPMPPPSRYQRRQSGSAARKGRCMMGPMSLEYGRRAWTCPAMTNDAARAARTHAAGEAGPRVTAKKAPRINCGKGNSDAHTVAPLDTCCMARTNPTVARPTDAGETIAACCACCAGCAVRKTDRKKGRNAMKRETTSNSNSYAVLSFASSAGDS